MPTSFGEKPNAEDIVKTLAEHIRGKVILVTGVSPGGLGATFVEAVAAAQPKLLILAARTTAKAEATAARVTETAPGVATRVLRLDLASQKQVRVAAADVNAYSESIDVLVNNAGIMAGPYRKSEDGIEMQFAANYIGPFLFTNLIMGKLLAAGPGARVVNVSSDGYRLGAIRYHDWNFHDGESYNQWVAYGQSKTANLLFSQSLAHRLGSKGLYSYSLHPGVTQTNLSGDLGQADFDGLIAMDKQLGCPQGWAGLNFITPSQCAATHVVAAFSSDIKDQNGGHLERCSPLPLDEVYPWALGEREARKCWELTERILGEKFSY